MSSPADTRFREAEYLAACQIAAEQLQTSLGLYDEDELDEAASALASRYRKQHEDVLLDIEEAILGGEPIIESALLMQDGKVIARVTYDAAGKSHYEDPA